MTFYSLSFVIFFACLILLLTFFKLLYNKKKISDVAHRKVSQIILLLASYAFMCLSDYRFCLILLGLTAVIYFCGVMISKRQKQGGSGKVYMALGVIISVAVLCVFKYLNFFIDSLEKILGITEGSALVLLLPLGISFFTFTAISYIVDIYRKKAEASTDFVKVALYISFFPKIISGPIVKGREFLPQLDENRFVSIKGFSEGIQIFLFGLVKKLVLADHLSVFVKDVFYAPAAFSSFTVILAVLSYTLQIYLDFSGYSDMAIGVSRILSYDLCKNFNIPYISKNVTEFWKRWHISLSSWLMEYLYIPLGGNRKGKVRLYINLLLTMLIGGLWHGASVTFIVWGALHGLGLCIHKVFMQIRNGKRSKIAPFTDMLSTALTLIFVALCWVFFRAESFTVAWSIITKMFVWTGGIGQLYSWTFVALAAVIIATTVAIFRSKKKPRFDKKGLFAADGFYPVLDLTKFWSLVLFFVVAGLAIGLAYTGGSPFIYGNF